jgi:single-strand DNA-binding protein
MNSVCLVGRMVWDGELKYTPGGVAVCKLRIAVDRQRKDSEGNKQSDFIDVVCFKQSAEFASNYLGKGRLIAVTGRLQSSQWVTDTGEKRSKLEVVCDSIQGLDRTKDGREEPQAQEDNYEDIFGDD